jgi:hydroxycarboxylate dehydrogenase B
MTHHEHCYFIDDIEERKHVVLIPHQKLESFSVSLLKSGFTRQEAAITAKSLVLSNLMGHDSHGVIRIREYLHALNRGEVVSGAALWIVSDKDAACVADGQKGLGQVQMPRLLDKLEDKARTFGCASGALRNCGHVGRLGEWTEHLAARGLVAIVAVNDNGAWQCVAPPGGKEVRTSTNPIAFGVPLPGGKLFSFDMSTSTVAIGKIRLAYLSGHQCPEGLLQDAEGRPTSNPAVLFEAPQGALKPFGGMQDYKGFGLSIMIDCLTAGLSGGFTPPAPEGTAVLNNVVVMVWDADAYVGLSHVQEQAQKYLDYVRSTAPIDPEKPVRLPGDNARREKKNRLLTGIPLTKGTVKMLTRLAESLSITVPDEFCIS